MSLDREEVAAGVVAAAAATVAFLVSSRVFTYHSSNHDEGVYLQGAEMLLDGRLRMRTGELTEAFRPWFFVADGGMVYPKYTPVASAVFAAGEAVYSFRAALVVVAAVNILLVYAVAAEAFDRRVGALASGAALLSPLFVVQSSMFLSYAPTTAFNLGFALAYLRAWKRRDVRYAATAGACSGVAFFSRPYTAVVFAAPFVVHAAYVVASERRRETFVLYGATTVAGLLFVGLTLSYNAVMTGDALVFPYLEFAPQDGVGFGERSILGYSRDYTPELALRANARVLYRFVFDWGPGGVVGAALALIGIARVTRERTTEGALVVGVAFSAVVGNLFFWGNLNILGDLSDPADGLLHLYGTLYHFDLLLPACALAAAGLVAVYEGGRARTTRRSAVVIAVVVAVLFVAVGGANTAAKIDENSELRESYAAAYEPFEENEYAGIVFLPTPYGNWLNHPFQYLRNDPGLNGTTVYATDRGAENLDVVDAYPDRDLYRYAYRGPWEPYEGEVVEPVVERLRVVEGDIVRLRTAVELPDDASSVTATLGEAGQGSETVEIEQRNGMARVEWLFEPGRVSLGGAEVATGEEGEATLEITVTRRYDSFRYVQRLSYEETDAGVRVIAPPYTERCYSYLLCGGEAAEVNGAVTTEASAATPEEAP